MAEEKITTDIDDWLSDLDDPGTVGELQQDDIASLLGEEAGERTAAAEQPSEFDQEAIDNLMAEPAPAEPDPFAMPAEAAPAPAGDLTAQDMDQDEIDALFSSSSTDLPPGKEEASLADLFGKEGDHLMDFGGDGEFDLDAFTLDPTVSEPTEATAVDSGPEPAAAAAPIPPPESGPRPAAATPPPVAAPPPPAGKNRMMLAAGGLFLLLLLGGGSYLLLGPKPAAPPPAIPPEQTAATPAETASPPAAANTPPVALGSMHHLDKRGEAIEIRLDGRDTDGDTLSFEVTSLPGHGRLIGVPPVLTYQPGQDFGCSDSFTFRATDGRQFSEPATAFITGPDPLVQQAAPTEPAPAAEEKPAPGPPAARNLTLATDSATPLVIDWRKIWARANSGPFDDTVAVRIDKKGIKGDLDRLSSTRSRYRPPKYFSGREQLGYSFVADGMQSKQGRLTIEVKIGDHPPRLHLSSFQDTYTAGQTVILDASASTDDARDRLTFSWRQTGGVPVRVEPRNREGSVVAFVMPAFFSTETRKEVALQLTATDPSGQTASREIRIAGRSRRTTALWGLLPHDSLADRR
ncbi:MAG: Ig-like domain-containing protein [Thermodesulfobacteriota bacterium]